MPEKSGGRRIGLLSLIMPRYRSPRGIIEALEGRRKAEI